MCRGDAAHAQIRMANHSRRRAKKAKLLHLLIAHFRPKFSSAGSLSWETRLVSAAGRFCDGAYNADGRPRLEYGALGPHSFRLRSALDPPFGNDVRLDAQEPTDDLGATTSRSIDKAQTEPA